MAKNCAGCAYMRLSSERNTDGYYWCEHKGTWIPGNAVECYKYCRSSRVSDYQVRSIVEYCERKNSSSSGCYLTTITCDILEQKDNNKCLNNLRKFRDEVLQKDSKYHSILTEYDIVGPTLATNLKNDDNRVQIAKNLYNLGISKVCECLENGLIEEAIRIYKTMTELLMQGYNVTYNIDDAMIKNEDHTKSGHGRYLAKTM